MPGDGFNLIFKGLFRLCIPMCKITRGIRKDIEFVGIDCTRRVHVPFVCDKRKKKNSYSLHVCFVGIYPKKEESSVQ
jgi:hypothetical protein